jgi:hypothetical protein
MKAPRDEIIPVNGVNLCVDSIGDPSDPPILLIMGSRLDGMV